LATHRETDVIVLGVGTCGEDLSLRLLDSGLEVVGIEAALVGGECPYWACLPSKMMIRAGNLLQEARRVGGIAGHAEVTPDWAPVAARVRAEATGDWDDSVATERFGAHGGLLVHGRGKLTGPRTVAVGDQSFTARRGIVIATGSKPAIPPVPGLEEVEYWTNREAIQADPLPNSLIVLGGGAVGCEFAQVFARFGTEVTIIEGRERLLALEEPEAAAAATAAFDAEGIAVHTGRFAERVEARHGGIVVTLPDDLEVVGDRLLVATGRTVELDNLGLDAAGLDESARFIDVDERMRAGDGIWAMGDVTGKAMFTHVAMYQGAIVAADILGEDPPPARYDAVPRVTFTDPEVGAVGMTEEEAHVAGLDVAVAVKQLPVTFRGWLHATGGGFIKLVMDRTTRLLVGATAVGPHGGDVLGMLSLAVHAKVPLEELRTMIYAFPTFHGGVGEAIGAYGRGLGAVFDPEYDAFAVFDG
jgi:pyruvate/2-oxoglutarate dehydrogenase complex dihydrolipoamide dehydrogenase (E3) component